MRYLLKVNALDFIHRSVVTTIDDRLTLVGKDILCEKVRILLKNVGGILILGGKDNGWKQRVCES
jgi:hypothetical protein